MAETALILQLAIVAGILSGFSDCLRYNYGDGSFYVGNVDQRGRPTGYGKFYNSTGVLGYEGEFSEGVPEGNGTWFGANGDVIQGQFVNGRANGHAVLRNKDGDMMEGEFVDHLPEGPMFLQKANGERIEGQFRRGLPHGRIVWRSPDRVRMDGAFRLGRPHGYVKVFDEEGNKIFEGKFIEGRPAVPTKWPTEMDAEHFRYGE